MNETLHPMTEADRAAMTNLRAALAKKPFDGTRAAFDALWESVPDAPGVTYERGGAGVAGVWCRPEGARRDAALLYLHGGAFALGSAQAFRKIVGHLAVRTRLACFVLDYRLAPEHPFPAAMEDARAALEQLTLGAGREGIVLAGDSAGGGIALALLGTKTHERAAEPRAAIAFSPWTDLALTGESLRSRATADPIFTLSVLQKGASRYLNGADPRNPLASALYADFTHLPPVQLQVGSDEILLDDSRRFAARTNAELHVWEGMPHGFFRNLLFMDAARSAMDLAAAFVTRRF